MNFVNPEISVILTAFNSEKYIARAINSIFSQTFKNYELLVVDDGSNDNTVKIINSISNQLQLFCKKNGGPSSARNHGISKAKGKFICFFDADDYWMPEKLQRQYDIAINNPNINIFSCNLTYTRNNKKLGKVYDTKKVFRSNDKKSGIVEDYIRPFARYSFHQPTGLMVRKELFSKYGLFDEKLKGVEDSEIALRWGIYNQKFYFQDEDLVEYEIGNPESLTKDIISWSLNHFKYWIKNDHITSLKGERMKNFLIMREKTLLNSIRIVIFSGQPSHARYLLRNYYIYLKSINWFVLYCISFIPFNYFKVVKKIIQKYKI